MMAEPNLIRHTSLNEKGVTMGVSNAVFDSQETCVTGSSNADVAVSNTGADPGNRISRTGSMSPKDQGYAWVILMASVAFMFISSCGLSISGIMILELENTFKASPVELNMAATTQFPICLCTSVLGSLLIPRFSVRVLFISGSILATIGHVASSFAPNIHLFFLTHGLISGFGLSLSHIGCLTSLSQYFDKRKSLAMGLFFCGVSVGYFALPPTATVLFSYYGWKGGFLLLAGLHLQGCILGALMRPFREDNDTKAVNGKTVSHCNGCLSKVKVFQSPYLLVHLCLSLLGFSPYTYPSAYLPTLGAGIGKGMTQASFLVSVFGISAGWSRPLSGLVGDLKWMRTNRFTLLVFAYLLWGLAKICCAMATTYTHLVLYGLAEGLANGIAIPMTYTISTDLVRRDYIPFTNGVTSVMAGTALLGGSYSLGFFHAYFSDVGIPAIISGSIQLVVGALFACVHIHKKLSSDNVYDVNA